jgi:DNA-3-methyladenine glycosylase II
MRRLKDAHSNFDPKAWRRYGPTTDPFGTLLRVVIGQQVSTSAARAILGRLSALFGDKLPIPSELLAAEEEELRSVGLSRQKLSYLRNLAERVESGALDLDRLADLSDDEVRERLMALKGIGPWSADMFLLRELGRPDVLPSRDVGLRKAVQKAYGLLASPTPAEVDLLGEKWRPHRSLATAYLFASLDDRPSPSPVSGRPTLQRSDCCGNGNTEISKASGDIGVTGILVVDVTPCRRGWRWA